MQSQNRSGCHKRARSTWLWIDVQRGGTAMPRIGRLSPFHFYQGSAILERRANTALDLSVLAAATVAATVIAYWQFSRRDL